LRMADRLERNLAQQKGVQEHLDYLRKREMLVQYPQFRRDGWPIGSGMMESANKNVVEARWQRERGCIGSAPMSIPCSHYAMPSAMIVGRRCGKRRSSTIESSTHSKGPCGLSLGHRLFWLLALPLRCGVPSSICCHIEASLFSGTFAWGSTFQFLPAFHCGQTPEGAPSCELFTSPIRWGKPRHLLLWNASGALQGAPAQTVLF